MATAPAAVAVTGFSHIAISVTDLDATLAELSGRGISPARAEAVGGGRKATVFDNDGNSVAIIQVPA